MTEDQKDASIATAEVLDWVTDIVAAYVGNNSVPADELPGLIREVHHAVLRHAHPASVKPDAPKPAVPVKMSVHGNHLVCLECGKGLRMLRRHLRTEHSMSPEEYRQRWDLPSDYPMVAPQYAAKRSELAKEIGLGKRKAGTNPADKG